MSDGENSASGDGKKVIKVEVALTEEIKKIMNEKFALEQKLAERETVALELFEMKKAEAVRAYPQMAATLKACNDPATLERFIDSAHSEQVKEFEKHGTASRSSDSEHKPSGKAIIGYSGNSGSETFDSKIVMVDELYKRAYYSPSEYTKEQVTDAKKKIETLLQTMVESPSFHKAFRERGNIQKLQEHSFEACPKCNFSILDSEYPCKNCGWDPRKKNNDPYYFKGQESKAGNVL